MTITELRIGPACKAGLSAGMRRERVHCASPNKIDDNGTASKSGLANADR